MGAHFLHNLTVVFDNTPYIKYASNNFSQIGFIPTTGHSKDDLINIYGTPPNGVKNDNNLTTDSSIYTPISDPHPFS